MYHYRDHAALGDDMDIGSLVNGQRVMLEDGSIAEVLEPSSDGASVRARYIEAPFAPALMGQEATLTDYEIVGLAEDAGQ
jgi:hypothetical protein